MEDRPGHCSEDRVKDKGTEGAWEYIKMKWSVLERGRRAAFCCMVAHVFL